MGRRLVRVRGQETESGWLHLLVVSAPCQCFCLSLAAGGAVVVCQNELREKLFVLPMGVAYILPHPELKI